MKKSFVYFVLAFIAVFTLACSTIQITFPESSTVASNTAIATVQSYLPTARPTTAPTIVRGPATPHATQRPAAQSDQQRSESALLRYDFESYPNMDHLCAAPCHTYVHWQSGVIAQSYGDALGFGIDLAGDTNASAYATTDLWIELFGSQTVQEILDCNYWLIDHMSEVCSANSGNYNIVSQVDGTNLIIIIFYPAGGF